MWKISALSNLNTDLASIKTIVHLTGANGQSHSIQLDIPKDEIKKLTLEEIEEKAIKLSGI
ncbi:MULTISPECIES: hypothetical protein [Serratia]|uniref:hypothetical protein n=1 Tax=Serratia TaxID=613 RepID=UPI001AE48C98|nr:MULTISPECIES: hypothetical protein [Serratia]MBP1133761.1 hypothetical protein [Serratia sp. PL17]